MKLVGLISGGKDSIFNMLQCTAAGHEIIAVANIEPEKKVELDSYMYQSVGHEALTLIAEALSLPIFRHKTKGKAFCLDKTYVKTPNDEVEDLYELLKKVKKEMPIEGVSVGAIASDYQRTRVENVCQRLNLKCFAFLWRRNQTELLQEMIDAELHAIIIKVASIGLNPNVHLGMDIKEIKDNLVSLNKKFGVNVCGEGGEYETFTLDCPLFHRKINITEFENVILSNDAFAPVGFLNIKSAELKSKFSSPVDLVKGLQSRLDHIQAVVKHPHQYVEDCMNKVTSNTFTETSQVGRSEHEISLPFVSNERIKSSLSISQHSKKRESNQQLFTNRLVKSTSALSTTTSSHFNCSTGWCCIGNIAASDPSEAFSVLKKHLNRINYGFEDIVFVTLFVRDMNEFGKLNNIYSEFITDVSPPSRVCVATELPPNVGIIMLVVAHKAISESQKVATNAVEKEVMYVRSISHWAPANIGPYSQCVKIGEIYYLAGQIPLIPGTMELFNQPVYHQCLLALRHVIRILQAMNEQLDYSNILQAICYVTSENIAFDINSIWTTITKNDNTTVTAIVVTQLPKQAQLEWEVLACNFSDPQGEEMTQTTEDFVLQMKRCIYAKSSALSFLGKVSFAKKKLNKDEKNLKIITENGVQTAINLCLRFAEKGVKNLETSLCVLKFFYKSNELVIGPVIRDMVKFYLDSKVVVTAIPVVACEHPDVIFTVTGVYH